MNHWSQLTLTRRAMADAVLGMSTGLRDDFTPEQPRTIATTTPTRLQSWIHDHLIPRL